MKLDSKYFDSIRTKPKREEPPQERLPCCQWRGCGNAGRYRAPMGRGRDGEYFHFCIDHVRQYNASYNYFDGMSDAEVVDFQRDAVTGHRPTWKTGAHGLSHGKDERMSNARHHAAGGSRSAHDPHAFFAWRARQAREAPPESRRQVRPLERKSLETLHLSISASRDQIKARFKELVKRHHPDANGGDRRSEEKLREIIQAYNYLKQAGLV
jgi:hypothetical protein